MPSDFTKLGVELSDLQAAFPDRLAEANDLLGLHRYGSSMGLALYALEIYLKVRICKTLDLTRLPTAFQTHDLDGLLVLSGLKSRLDVLGNHPVKVNWDSLSSPSLRAQHVNELRYKSNANWTLAQAEDILERIQNPTTGVLIWMQAQA